MKINKKIITSLCTIFVMSALGIGATYALFTSNNENKATINAGKVKVKSGFSNLATYSAQPGVATDPLVDEYGNHYSQPATAVTGTFTTGGTASISADNSTIILDRAVPGDKVTFKYSIDNESNVTIKYRYMIECSSESVSDIDFFSKLIFKVGTTDFTGVSSYVALWDTSSSAGNILEKEISIEVPMTLPSKYADRNCGIKFTVDAVQGNAAVNDDAAGFRYVQAAPSTDITAPTADVVLKNDDESIKATVTKADAQKIVNDLIPTPEAGATYNVDLGLLVEEEPSGSIDEKLLDISYVATVKKTNSQGTTVSTSDVETLDNYAVINIKLNAGLMNVKVTHNGIELPETSDESLDQGQGIYTYDSSTGLLVIKTKTFSPFGVKFLQGCWADRAASSFSDIDTGNKKIGIHNEAEMALFANTNASYNGYTVSLKADLDFTGYYWQPISITWGHRFTFDGENHTIEGLFIDPLVDPKGTSDAQTYTGFFVAFAGTAKNIIFRDCYSRGERVGIFAGASRGNLEIENVKAIDCEIVGGQKCGAIVGVLFGQQDDGSTFHLIKNCYVENLILSARDVADGLWQSGGVIGYIGILVSVDVIGNTVKNVVVINDGCEDQSYDDPYYCGELIGSVCNYGTATYPISSYNEFTINIKDNIIISAEDNGIAKCPKMDTAHYFIGWVLYESTAKRNVYKVVVNDVEITTAPAV